jgi:hypothetical protein
VLAAFTRIICFESVHVHTLEVIQLKVAANTRRLFGGGDAAVVDALCHEVTYNGTKLTYAGYSASGTYRSMFLRVEHLEEKRTGDGWRS